MVIAKVECVPIRLPLEAPLVWGKGNSITHTDYVIVRVYDQEGRVGVAEATPRPMITGESMQSVVYAIESWLAPLVVGLPLTAGLEIEDRLRRVRGNATAKGALDIALHDLMGKALGLPVSALFGTPEQTPRVPVGYTLGQGSVSQTVEQALALREQHGIFAFKLKVGVDAEADIARFQGLRREFGARAILWADANRAMDPLQLARRLRALQELDVLCIEEPLECGDTATRRRLEQQYGIPFMTDESTATVEQIYEALAGRAWSYVALKLSRTGFRAAARILFLADQVGGVCLVGSQGGTGLSVAACLQLAPMSSAAHRQVAEVGHVLRIPHSLIQEPMDLQDGTIAPFAGPGLGVTLDEAAIKSLRL